MSDLPLSPRGWRAVLSVVRRVARASDDDAEDLLHSAFVRLAEYRERASVVNPAAFLVRTAANLAVDERRRRARRETVTDVAELLEIADEQPLQSEVLAARERLQRVMAGLESLGPRTREIFLMHRIEGLKYREIADRLGVTVSAVEKHIAKATLYLVNWAEGE